MVEFKQDGYYTLQIDKAKNRIKMHFTGYWDRLENVPHYIEHIKKLVDELKPGFTVYARIEGKKPPKLFNTSLQKQVQKIYIDKGFARTAVVLDEGAITQKMMLLVVGKLSGMNVKVFYEKQEGEASKWLDEVGVDKN